jgi:hypothetical protein
LGKAGITASEVFVAGEMDATLSRYLAERLKDAGVGTG